jgi:hypothetical protein
MSNAQQEVLASQLEDKRVTTVVAHGRARCWSGQEEEDQKTREINPSPNMLSHPSSTTNVASVERWAITRDLA